MKFTTAPMLTDEDIQRCRQVALGHRSTVFAIAEIVAAETGVGIREIYSRRRRDRIVQARQLVMFIAAANGLTTTQIGLAMDRDHTTVVHGIAAERRRRTAKAPE